MTERILLISPFFHPEPISTGRYNCHLAKALQHSGAVVEVICFHPLYPDWRPIHSDASLDGVGIRRGGAWLRYPRSNLLRRAVLEVGFLLHILKYAHRIKRYSKVVAVLPPMFFLPIVWVTSRRTAYVSVIVHDLQGVMAGASIRKRHRSVISFIRFIETRVLRCCHRVIVLSNPIKSFLSETYRIPASKITVCLPFVTLEERHSMNRLEHFFAENKKHVVYAGALGTKQNPDYLISFFQHLVSQRHDVVCHIFSAGPIFNELKLSKKPQNDRLAFHDLVPEKELYELYQRSHIQVIPERIGFSHGALPSKLPNLLASGAPILYIGTKSSYAWQIIQGINAGLCAGSWAPELLTHIVDQLLVDGSIRPHSVRRKIFKEKYSKMFSIEPLIKELIG